MRELALFAGAGGGILGGMLTGFKTVCAVEIDAYCRNVLLARQRDGALPLFPIWDDVRTFDGRPWRGKIDVITGGFPCQDISAAGKGTGITGARSGLVWEMFRIVEEVRPKYVFVENSPNLRTRGLREVLEAFASMGYDARWGMMRDGVCWGLGTSVRHTDGTECGYWQTPVADDCVQRKDGKYNSRGEPKLSAQVLLPTPTATMGDRGGRGDLLQVVRGNPSPSGRFMLPTPTAVSYGSSNNGCPGDGRKEYATRGKPSLQTMARNNMWPMPTAKANMLCPSMQKWPAHRNLFMTPTCQDAKNNGSPSQQRRRTKPLNAVIGGSLNPAWVEWLMGWPVGWTALKPLGMGKFRQWQHSHGGYYMKKVTRTQIPYAK